MQERIDTTVLSAALGAVKSAVHPRMPYLRLDPTEGGLELTADNRDLAIRATVPGWSPLSGGSDRSVMVPYAPLAALVAKLSGEVEMVVTGEDLALRCGRLDATLPLVDDAWTARRVEPEGDEVRLTIDEWDRLVALVGFADPDASKTTHALRFDGEGATATDTMAAGRWHRPFDIEANVPASAVAALADLKGADQEVVVTLGERSASIRADSGYGPIEVATTLIEGKYPSITKLLEGGGGGTITVEMADVRPAVERVAIASRQFSTKGRQMILRPIDDGGLELISLPGDKQTGQRITEVVEADVTGVDTHVGINSAYFLSACDLIAGRTGAPTIHIDDPLKPLRWQSEDASALNTVVRIPDGAL